MHTWAYICLFDRKTQRRGRSSVPLICRRQSVSGNAEGAVEPQWQMHCGREYSQAAARRFHVGGNMGARGGCTGHKGPSDVEGRSSGREQVGAIEAARHRFLNTPCCEYACASISWHRPLCSSSTPLGAPLGELHGHVVVQRGCIMYSKGTSSPTSAEEPVGTARSFQGAGDSTALPHARRSAQRQAAQPAAARPK